MPYAYQAGDYAYQAGGYPYQAGGIFSSIGKALKGAVGFAAKAGAALLPGPLRLPAQFVSKALTARPGGGMLEPRPMLLQDPYPFPTPGKEKAFAKRQGLGLMGPPRRRMNPMNVKALRRASRRIDGFAKTARRALKHTPFVLVRRGARVSRGSVGVITRSEAARALKR